MKRIEKLRNWFGHPIMKSSCLSSDVNQGQCKKDGKLNWAWEVELEWLDYSYFHFLMDFIIYLYHNI